METAQGKICQNFYFSGKHTTGTLDILSHYNGNYEGRDMLANPETVLQVTEVVMSVKSSQVGNFFILATKASTTLLSTIKNCFRMFVAPWKFQ